MRPRRAIRVSVPPSATRKAELRHLHPTPQSAEWRKFDHHDFNHHLSALLPHPVSANNLTTRDIAGRRAAAVIRHQGRYLRNVEGARGNQVVRCTIEPVPACHDALSVPVRRNRCQHNHHMISRLSGRIATMASCGGDRRGARTWRAPRHCPFVSGAVLPG